MIFKFGRVVLNDFQTGYAYQGNSLRTGLGEPPIPVTRLQVHPLPNGAAMPLVGIDHAVSGNVHLRQIFLHILPVPRYRRRHNTRHCEGR